MNRVPALFIAAVRFIVRTMTHSSEPRKWPWPIFVTMTILALCQPACTPRLDEQQVRARLVEQLQLQADQLRVVTISSEELPIATIDYGGARAGIRFRRQDGVWVIDAVAQEGRWESADRALPVLASQLTARARAKRIESVMPRYARTLKLLVGWTELLSTDCGNLPTSQNALINLHAAWHRTLFPNRGGEFHNFDLFIRDAWWKPFRLTMTSTRVQVESGGADARLGTADDVQLVFTRKPVGSVEYCAPRYTMPASVADALGSPDAPKEWNCSDLLTSLKTAEMLELVAERR